MLVMILMNAHKQATTFKRAKKNMRKKPDDNDVQVGNLL